MKSNKPYITIFVLLIFVIACVTCFNYIQTQQATKSAEWEASIEAKRQLKQCWVDVFTEALKVSQQKQNGASETALMLLKNSESMLDCVKKLEENWHARLNLSEISNPNAPDEYDTISIQVVSSFYIINNSGVIRKVQSEQWRSTGWWRLEGTNFVQGEEANP